jgi:NAD(P)-dependent dehydrogenase (short-subunit alcohol dehydrogenase family)
MNFLENLLSQKLIRRGLGIPKFMPDYGSELLGLSGKAAIVTGAARGIGGAETRLFSKLGVNIVALDLNFEEVLIDGPGRVVKLQADVSASDSAEKAVSKCMNEFGRLDILVNNAAVNKGGTVLDYKKDEWDQTLAVNIGGCRNFARAAANEMKKKRSGRIINTSSVDGMMAEPGILAYSATKGAIIIMTRCMASELAPFGITVNSIAPGWCDTPFGTGMLDAASRRLVENKIPLGHIAQPEEIAKGTIFLASDLSSYMTGHILVVDGGLTTDISIPGLKY